RTLRRNGKLLALAVSGTFAATSGSLFDVPASSPPHGRGVRNGHGQESPAFSLSAGLSVTNRRTTQMRSRLSLYVSSTCRGQHAIKAAVLATVASLASPIPFWPAGPAIRIG